MTHISRRALFRAESVAHHQQGRGSGQPLRLSSPWVRWGYRVFLVLLACTALAAQRLRIEQSVSGPAVMRAGSTILAVPLGTPAPLAAGRKIQLRVAGQSAEAVVLEATPVARATAARRLGIAPAKLSWSSLLLVRAQLVTPAEDTRSAGRAVVVVGSESLLSALLGHFHHTSEPGDG